MEDAVKRTCMGELAVWKGRSGRKPLILKGARQTGKTWLVKEFGRQEFTDTVTIDFMLDESYKSLFIQDLDPRRIIAQIELREGRRIDPENTLLFFDEIQEAPRGIASLKYFCEQAYEYHVIAAGSYMGLGLRREGESFPVGKVDTLTLYPLTFVEFIRAVAGDMLADALETGDMALLGSVSDMLERRLKEYMVIGGMPEVVARFAATGDYAECRRLQNDILQAYDADFSKHAPVRLLERMRMAWRSIPGQLAHENKKFIYGAVRPGARARDFEEALQWLEDYGVVYKVPRVAALRVPLVGYEDLSAFKLFCCDLGLLGAMAGLSEAAVLDEQRVFTEFKGALTEQYVLQEYVAQGERPVYWANDSGSAEIDFALGTPRGIIPVEVKAGENLRAKSLRVACDKFCIDRAVRTSLASYRDDGWLVNVPLWAVLHSKHFALDQ